MEIYIHIPFCLRKCAYCDFLSFQATQELQDAYVQALCREIRRVPPDEKGPVSSVYIGGGTPSLLELSALDRIFSMLHTQFSILPEAEISMEANPGTVTMEKLTGWRQMGITRLSLGLQSTSDSLLRLLGRIHTAEDFFATWKLVRQAGFENVNIDLMFALPTQTAAQWADTLKTVAGLEPAHLSAYSLILEENTALAKKPGIEASLPDEDTQLAMFEMTAEILAGYGFHQYEISNYARPGRECLHNLGYWKLADYLGLGLGAASFLHHTHFSNTLLMKEYLQSSGDLSGIRRNVEKLSVRDEMSECMFLALRTMEGLSLAAFAERFGCKATEVFREPVRKYSASGHLSVTEDHIRLTRRGLFVSNQIMADMLLEDS